LKQLVILSGKGGTGKTTVAAALVHLASQEAPIVFADADVDAANLELVLEPTVQETHNFVSGKLAVIDPSLCEGCGICAEVCRYDAIVAPSSTPQPPPSPPQAGEREGVPPPAAGEGERAYQVEPIACEGCAACFYQCPTEAIRLDDPVAGQWFRSDTRFGPLFHAHLFAGQENSGKLVTTVKQQGRLRALDEGCEWLIVDGPPGIGCPVISASAGADLALLVVEPTVSGVHDLERVLATTNHFRVPALVAINKADINPARADEIAAFCREQGVEVVGRIPYDDVVTEAMVQGLPVTAFKDGAVAAELKRVWQRVRDWLSRTDPAGG
jgi:MinD superfamily P-loop ATPase